MYRTPRHNRWLFTLAVTAASRYFLWRDRRSGRWRPLPTLASPGASTSRLRIECGLLMMDAVWVEPANCRAAVLLCHGIGEVVEHWYGVQCILAASGIASLIFDYPGYGQSTGRVSVAGCESGALAAWAHLAQRASGVPLALLGFSMGSGVACNLLAHVAPASLTLCAAFSSFADAVARLGMPRRLASGLWDNTDTLRHSSVPLLVVQGGRDRLFPETMARRLLAAAKGPAQLVVAPGVAHEDIYARPSELVWGPIARHILGGV